MTNFGTSWCDGLALCALIHFHHPDLIAFGALNPQHKEQNIELAFTTAEKLGVPPVLTVGEVVSASDPNSMNVYVNELYKHFQKSKQ